MRRAHEPLELPTEFDRQFGQRLMQAREAAGLSRIVLAAMIGTDEAEIEAWELGLIVVYFDELEALCQALQTTPNYLLGKDRQ